MRKANAGLMLDILLLAGQAWAVDPNTTQLTQGQFGGQ